MARIKQQSHRVTEARRLSQVKALKVKDVSPAVCEARESMQGLCLNAHRNGIGKAAAMAAVGVGMLAAKEAFAQDYIMLMDDADSPKEPSILYSPEVSTALAVAAIVSTASTVFFGISAYKSRRDIPGIVGPSGLVPLGFRKEGKEGENPFRNEGVSDEEYARIKKEQHVWGKKNRKERYMLQVDLNSFDVALHPTDFTFTFNKTTLPLVASLGAAILCAALWMESRTPQENSVEAPKVEQKAE